MESLREENNNTREEPSLKQKTAKGLLWGGMSNLIQQLLGAFFGVYISRILTPEDYGAVAVLLIFPVLASTLQESGFVSAITNQKQVEHKDYNAVFWFSGLIGLSLYIILFFCAPLIASFYDMPELTPLARYLFLSFLISSMGTAHNAYLFRNLKVKQRAIGTTIALLISGIAGVIMAYNGKAYWGIATQTVLYVLVNTTFLWIFSSFRPTFHFDFSPVKKMFAFSSKVLITNLFLQFNTNIITTILGKFYTKSDAGAFNQANKWNIMGQSVLLGMSRSVAQPILTSVHEEEERQLRVFRKILSFTAFMTFPLIFGLSSVAKEFIEIFLTNKWQNSAYFLELLCIGGAFVPLADIYANLALSKGKSNIYMWNVIALSLTQLALFLLVYPYGISSMILVYVITNILWLFVWHYFVSNQIGLQWKHLFADVFLFAAIASVAVAGTYLITMDLTLHLYIHFILKIIITAILYTTLVWFIRPQLVKECITFLKLDKFFKSKTA
ncbi:lipopolysaccharide biosynthesis protein [Sphingobacterium spiritivorum]|uniref:lipopolysaccharide biosynthesis protein n=1 Tax=Sphingobacterium spiritivorum TaxID=258 RepID=UPI003DA2D918